MTSLAFGLGVLPLALTSGAGSGAQRAIGTGVLDGLLLGMLQGALPGIFFITVLRDGAAAAWQSGAGPGVTTVLGPGGG